MQEKSEYQERIGALCNQCKQNQRNRIGKKTCQIEEWKVLETWECLTCFYSCPVPPQSPTPTFFFFNFYFSHAFQMVSFSNMKNNCSSIQKGRGESVCVCGDMTQQWSRFDFLSSYSRKKNVFSPFFFNTCTTILQTKLIQTEFL